MPVSASFQYELGVDPSGALIDLTLAGATVPPSFYVTLADVAGAECVLGYDLDVAAFNIAYVAGSTKGRAFRTWRNGLSDVLGYALEAGLYTGRISQGCSLDPAVWTNDPHAGFLGGTWQFGVADGVTAAQQSALTSAGGVALLFGAGFPAANVMGGNIGLPAGFLSGVTQFEAAGLAAQVDATGEIMSDGSGNLIPLNAASVYNQSNGTYTRAYYRMFSLWSVNF